MAARKFGDTSAIIKLYRDEPNSPLVRAQFDPTDDVLISRLTVLEFRSALLGAVRRGEITAAEAQARIDLFDADRGNFVVL